MQILAVCFEMFWTLTTNKDDKVLTHFSVHLSIWWDFKMQCTETSGTLLTWLLRESCGILTPTFHRKSHIYGTVMRTNIHTTHFIFQLNKNRLPTQLKLISSCLIHNTSSLIIGKMEFIRMDVHILRELWRMKFLINVLCEAHTGPYNIALWHESQDTECFGYTPCTT